MVLWSPPLIETMLPLLALHAGAMDRVAQIKSAREKRFWEKRMAPNKGVQKARDLAEVQQGLDLLVSPPAAG